MSIQNSISDPQIKYLYQLLDQIESGKLFVPKFQRGFIWKDEQRLDLLRSIKSGIPIGSLLVWETTKYRLATFDKIGGLSVPKPPESGITRTYLLDGHQRLSTLFGALKCPVNKSNIVDDIDWRVYYDLEEQDFLLQLRKDAKSTWMPVNVLLDNLALLKFLRKLTDDELIERADQVSKMFLSYKIPLVVVETNDLEHATTTFQRINSSGTRMSDLDMVAALVWSKQFDLREKILEVQERLAEVGWEKLDEKFILSACRGILNLALYKPNAEQTSNELKKNPKILDQAAGYLIQVAKFLKECGIFSPKVLPYNYQSVLLAEAMRTNLLPNDAVFQELKNWLWRSAYTEAFIGINDTSMANAVKDIISLAKGNVYKIGIKEKIAPLPKGFHFKSSRAKLLALRLAELTPQTVDGKTLNVGELLGLHGSYAILRLISTSSAPENCFIIEPQAFSQFRNYLLNSETIWTNDFLRSHAISETATQALKKGDYKSFLSERRKTLIELEKEFIQPLGLDYDVE
ncbi:GmrSD restriction endonuclease domain-containing protein [Candidatus Marithrix sp. Canyon 246]|uniref:GmrSD restriction endonuclease domain-containing protein n=1 Tax=Candidatus Marithrix sp. Canyon 246 TaxID=1827136 RepID=UPI00084A0474|nr:DUF262 domain-containing protein [Candidatus Marithrix sp. Canyon 246]